nr:reverse transcriptase domain-containing protein [Tanacetum cinerariifolium]
MQLMQNLYNKPSTSSSSLPSNTISNPKREAKAITTRSGMSYKEPPIPPTGVNQQKPVEKQDDFQNQMMQFMQNLYNKPSTSSSSLPSNTISNPKREAKAITTRSVQAEVPKDKTADEPVVKLRLPTLNDTKMVLELADRTISKPTGVADNVFVKRCMMAIFHDMIERTMEVFIDDFSVFGNSFSTCLTNLENMLK